VTSRKVGEKTVTNKLDAKKRATMRRLATALVTGVLLLAALGGLASARTERGTEGSDIIRGNDRADTLYGLGGSDVISGRKGDDELYGDQGNDEAHGGRGADLLQGGDETDLMNGGRGTDVLGGEAGGDYLYDGPPDDQGKDVLEGGEGGDFLYAVNEPATEDAVSCGLGTDTAVADGADSVSGDCEEVHRR
jgi:Ca2+-binding RTX toxin-like protein